MFTRATFVLLVVVFTCALTSASFITTPQTAEADEIWRLDYRVAGQDFRFVLHEDELVGSPRWKDPETSHPPLSISEAVRIAKTEALAYAPTVRTWILEEITLEHLGRDGAWLYCVSLVSEDDEHDLSIPVLMNGRPLKGAPN